MRFFASLFWILTFSVVSVACNGSKQTDGGMDARGSIATGGAGTDGGSGGSSTPPGGGGAAGNGGASAGRDGSIAAGTGGAGDFVSLIIERAAPELAPAGPAR